MVTINQNNYETWLMLYLDNELTAAEREAVEAFAKANPAVQEELDGLKDTLLQPEAPVAMPGKERLLMPEIWNEEALTPQQQQLLLLTDNELPAAEKASLETAISNDPLLQKEWGLLQNTRVATGKPLEMPGKDQLFRYERTRIIPFGRVLRFAAAAAILGFGWFAINNLTAVEQNTQPQDQVVSAPAHKSNGMAMGTDTSIISEASKQAPLKGEMLAVSGTENGKNKPAPAQKAFVTATLTETAISANDIAINNPPVENYTEPVSKDPAEKLTGVKVVDVAGISENELPPAISTEKVELVALHQAEKPVTTYEVMNAEEPNDDNTISIAGARIPKQKIRNVYRNLTRPITRTLDRSGQQLAYAK